MNKIVIGVLSSVLLMTGCGNSGMESPASPTAGLTPEALPLKSDSTVAPVVTPPNSERGCDVVQVDRNGIKVETKCDNVRFFVNANVLLGTGYYNIWLPAINAGTMLGPFQYGTWSSWKPLTPGVYAYTLAAETKTDSGKVYQCDRHKGTFTVPACKTGCVMPEAPKCEFGPALYDPKTCTWSCPPCVMPEPPKCQFGPPVPDGCGWVCPPCVLPPAPECPFGKAIPDMKACGWDCPPCVLPSPPQCEFGPPVPDREACDWTCPECQPEWIAQEPVRENETEYGLCVEGEPTSFLATRTDPPTIDCPGHKSRTVDIVIYEMNSCTQETREKSRFNVEEQKPCTAQCEQAFCHTENYKWSSGKWQCQNVPPGTPGHWPGHFNWPHGDFFGPCVPSKCYNITN